MKRKARCRCCSRWFVVRNAFDDPNVCRDCLQVEQPTITIKEQEGAKEE